MRSVTPHYIAFNGAAPEGAEELNVLPQLQPALEHLQWGRARRRGRTVPMNPVGAANATFNGAAPEGAEERVSYRSCS